MKRERATANAVKITLPPAKKNPSFLLNRRATNNGVFRLACLDQEILNRHHLVASTIAQENSSLMMTPLPYHDSES